MCTSPWLGMRRAGSRDPVQPLGVGLSSEFAVVKKGFELLQLPCGQCIECRLKRARDWATRSVLEARRFDQNWFLTLTYSEGALPQSVDPNTGEIVGTLHFDHFSSFMKRLRAYFHDKGHDGIRFLACSEYGSQTFRPHYHAIVFNLPLEDLRFYSVSRGEKIYQSDLLDRIWSHGSVRVGEATFRSCGYVARYITQKLTGKEGDFYDRHGLEAPALRMSRRPGLAEGYYQAEKEKIWRYDKLVLLNQDNQPFTVLPPRYFDEKSEKECENFDQIKRKRLSAALISTDQLLRSTDLTLENVNFLRADKIERSGVLTRVKF